MLTIQPGLFFGIAAVMSMQDAGLTDDDVARDVEALESGMTTPAEIIRDNRHHKWITLYVAGLCRCAGIDLRGVFGGGVA
jgi:hypothetical protein